MSNNTMSSSLNEPNENSIVNEKLLSYSNNKTTPKVSVIIPLYNKEDYIIEAIESCLNQTIAQLIKVIVIDDCSTDDSFNRCFNIYESNEQVLILRNSKNAGQGFSRNKGIDLCDTKYCYFLDADDVLDNSAIETAFNTASANDADVVICNFVSLSNSNLPAKTLLPDNEDRLGQILYILEHKFTMSACSRLYKTSYLKSKVIRFNNLYHEDTSFIFEAIYKARSVVNQYESIYRVRSVPGSISRRLTPRKITDYLKQYDIIHTTIEQSEFFSKLKSSWCIGRLVLIDKLILRVMLYSENLETAIDNRRCIEEFIVKNDINTDNLREYKNEWFQLSEEEFSEYYRQKYQIQ